MLASAHFTCKLLLILVRLHVMHMQACAWLACSHDRWQMKRIIDGSTYNTDTATLVAETTYGGDDGPVEVQLFQTPAGVYFNVDTTMTSRMNRHGETQERTTYEWLVVGDAAAARAKCEEWGLTIIRDIEDMPPEAEPGEKMATLYIRLPPSLKSAIETRATSQGASVNVFALRCLEGCVREQRALEDMPALDFAALMKGHGLISKANPKSVSWCLKHTTVPLFYEYEKEDLVVLALAQSKTPAIAKNIAFRASILKDLQDLGLRNKGSEWPSVSLRHLDTTDKREAFGAIVAKIVSKASEGMAALVSEQV